ncbi:TusE/DsrC/DsvC family sulfur relay protein [Buchnera aphidicola]|uniref:TusE/DsrC/DsvC family sulfur relay protein n=1 Tax=Buchnera aphidicola TaxID=9 RepID=UPI003BEEB244
MKKLKKKIHKYQDIEKDAEGYLKNNQNWNILIAQEIAQNENINLNSDHWKIIYFVRDFYFKFNMTPSMRMLINAIQKKIKNKKINSIYLFTLFPKGPAKQASKIAGIPKPAQCL